MARCSAASQELGIAYHSKWLSQERTSPSLNLSGKVLCDMARAKENPVTKFVVQNIQR